MREVLFSEVWWQFLLLVVGSYLVGNVNSAILISGAKKHDIRTEGSGNPGTLNMSRTFGLKVGMLTLFLDVLKGFVPSLVGYLFFRNAVFSGTEFIVGDLTRLLCGVSVVAGHIYPVLYGFKGGKGVASTIGVYLSVSPLVGILSIVLAVTFVYFTELGSVGSFIAITPPAVFYVVKVAVYYAKHAAPVGALIAVYALLFLSMFLVYFAHRKNIARLIRGTEHPTSIKAMLKKDRERKQEKKQETLLKKESGEKQDKN